MSVPEDTYINMIPYNLTDALKGDLDPNDQWKKLFMAVENSGQDGPPLDPGFMGQLELCNQRRESPTAKLLSDLGLKGYRVRHLRVWLRAQGLMRSAELLEGADRSTGHLPPQRSPSASEKSWMYKSESEHQRSQSAEGRGGGATIAMPSDCVEMYGSRTESDSSSETEGGGGGTIELSVESVTALGNTQRPREGTSQSEGAGVVERQSEPKGVGTVDGPSSTDSTSVIKGSSKLEVPVELDGSKTDDLNSLPRVSMSDPNSQHAVFRKKNEKAKTVSHTPSTESSPYQRHHLVGSGTVRQRGTTTSVGGSGSDLKEKAETESPQPLPPAPPPSTPSSSIDWCTIVLVAVIVVWIVALCIAVYNRQ